MVLPEKLVRPFRGPKDPILYRQAGRLLLLFLVLGLAQHCVTEALTPPHRVTSAG